MEELGDFVKQKLLVFPFKESGAFCKYTFFEPIFNIPQSCMGDYFIFFCPQNCFFLNKKSSKNAHLTISVISLGMHQLG